jgi:hypothetical protein
MLDAYSIIEESHQASPSFIFDESAVAFILFSSISKIFGLLHDQTQCLVCQLYE